jgi:hypothetical protein
LSLAESSRVATFIDTHRDELSKQAFDRAIDRMPEEIKKRLSP